MSSADAVATLIGLGRGRRPYSLGCQEAEDVLTIAMALTVELAAANDRIDRLERTVAELRGVALDELRDAPATPDVAAERARATDAMLARVFRILIDPREPADGRVRDPADA